VLWWRRMFTYLVGTTDNVDGKYIGTRFFALVGPLLPLSSILVTSESFERSGNRSTHRYEGFPLPLYWKSVLLGYLNVWLPILALAWPFLAHYGERVEFTLRQFGPTLALFAAWIVVLALPGRLSKVQKEQLRAMARYAGLPVDPRRLDRMSREGTREQLAAKLEAAGLPTTPEGCARAVPGASADEAGIFYTFARYAGAPRDLEWRRVADAAWERFATA